LTPGGADGPLVGEQPVYLDDIAPGHLVVGDPHPIHNMVWNIDQPDRHPDGIGAIHVNHGGNNADMVDHDINPELANDIVAGWQARRRNAADGNYAAPRPDGIGQDEIV